MNEEKISHIAPEARLGIILIPIVAFFAYSFSQIPEPLPAPVIFHEEARAVDMTEIIHGDRTKKQVIFTFDGGDMPVSGDKILDILERRGLRSTFFLTGKFIENNPILVGRMYSQGHEIFSHTYSHPYLTEISDTEIIEELRKTEEAFRKATGASMRPYFRPPYGDSSARVREVAFRRGYQSVRWTVDALDWQESEGRTPAEVKDIILSNLAPGTIYLMHIGDSITGDILDGLFSEIEGRGYNIVSLTQGI